MTNRDRYMGVVCEVLDVARDEASALVYQGVPTWDSVGHMALVAAVEDEFGIELEIDDVIDFSSVPRGAEILAKYGISLD